MKYAMILNAWWMAKLCPPAQIGLPSNRRPQASTSISLTLAAKRLGVTREHLSRVLHGHRESRSLLTRFQKLEQEYQP